MYYDEIDGDDELTPYEEDKLTRSDYINIVCIVVGILLLIYTFIAI